MSRLLEKVEPTASHFCRFRTQNLPPTKTNPSQRTSKTCAKSLQRCDLWWSAEDRRRCLQPCATFVYSLLMIVLHMVIYWWFVDDCRFLIIVLLALFYLQSGDARFALRPAMKPLAASPGGNGGGVGGKGVGGSVEALLRTTWPCQMQRPTLSSIQRQGDETGVGKCPNWISPNYWGLISNRYLKVMFKIPKKGLLQLVGLPFLTIVCVL